MVRAWAQDYTSWLIDYGQLGYWPDLEHLLFNASWPVRGSDLRMKVWRAALDTGGGKYEKDISSTEEAYLWLQDHSGFSESCRVWGAKGSSKPLPSKMKLGAVLTKTPSGKALRMGMRLAMLDTDKFKDMFYDRMAKAVAGGSASAWLHREVQADYARQITAEEKRDPGNGKAATWEPVRKDNHYLDCECLASAVADWEWPGGGVNTLYEPVNVMEIVKREEREKARENPFTGSRPLFGG